MSIEFKASTFFHPLAILKQRHFFERSQWFSENEFEHYQESRLTEILSRAEKNIPRYRNLLSSAGLTDRRRLSLQDLSRLPILRKSDLLKSPGDFLSPKRSGSWSRVTTSGTNGQPLVLFMDSRANILEFVYYWRLWSWAGYRLGDTFAELSSCYFLKKGVEQAGFHFQPLYSRLLLNSLSISPDSVEDYLKAIRKHRPLFLKGSPSALYYFCRALKEKRLSVKFKAVFSQGEVLHQENREFIEETLGCRVFDSYGHMERTAAISSCEKGYLHIHPEYGIVELLPVGPPCPASYYKLIGTSLHNSAMPLIRYDSGDIIELEPESGTCACGRRMPRVKKILGRREDIIMTPGGAAVTAIYVAWNGLQGVVQGQVIQESLDRLRIRMAVTDRFGTQEEEELLRRIRSFTGLAMNIEIEYVPLRMIHPENTKFRMVVSKVPLPGAQAMAVEDCG